MNNNQISQDQNQQQISSQGSTNEASFQLGVHDKKADARAQIKDAKTTKEAAEIRMQQTLGGNSQDDNKRKREDYAVQLRKQKREELFKAKRAFTGAKANQSDQQQQQQQNNMGAMLDEAQNDQLVSMSLEEALNLGRSLSVLDFHVKIQKIQFNIHDFPKLALLVNDSDEHKIMLAIVGIRRLLSHEQSPPIQATIDANLVPRFMQLLQRVDNPKFQFEAAWCLTNIASGDKDHVQVLIDKGVHELLVLLLQSQHIDVVEQAIWGIGNIAGDSYMCRNLIINQGAVPMISDILDKASPGTTFVRNASWTLSNLCRGRPAPNFPQVQRAIPSLAKVLKENDSEDILIDICWAMSFLSDGNEDARIPSIIQCDVVPRLIQLIEHQNIAIAVPCLRTMGNISTGDDHQTQQALDAGLLNALLNIVKHEKKTIRKEACWTISNITAGNSNQIQQCLDIGIVDVLIHLLQNDDQDVKKEAIWALSNTTSSAESYQFKILVEKGIFKGLSSVLDMQDARVLAVSLEGISNILKCGKENYTENGENQFALKLEEEGCLDKLEPLQYHQNHQIYEKISKLLEDYFQEEDDDIFGNVEMATTNTDGISQQQEQQNYQL